MLARLACCAASLALASCALDFDSLQSESRDGSAGLDFDAALADGALPRDAATLPDGGLDPSDATRDAGRMDAGAGDGALVDATTLACTSDADCPGVCELNLCVDCRVRGDCAASELCVAQRCVPDRKPSSVWMSAGGGLSSADGYKLLIGIGTPAPMGAASAQGYKLRIGPQLRSH